MQRIWVLCTRCDSSGIHAYMGAKSIGSGDSCPVCGSSWMENEIIASTVGKASSEILGDIRVRHKAPAVNVIWLST